LHRSTRWATPPARSTTGAMNMDSISIRGVGAFLPAGVRKNDYWSDAIVSNWESRGPGMARATANEQPDTPGIALTKQAMGALVGDPFKGAVERRIMGAGEKASD